VGGTALLILAALVASHGLAAVAEFLNLRALRPHPPEELLDVLDPAVHRRSAEYTRVRTRHELVEGTFHLTVLLLFWFGGGFNGLDRMVAGWGAGPVWGGTLFLALLLLGRSLLGLPFRIRSTFGIEARFGFNRSTPGTFAADLLKGLLLSAVLGLPLLAGILALFHTLGSGAWLPAWGVLTAFTLLVQWAAPAWILPLFNRFEPLEEGELRERIQAYAREVGFPLRDIYIMDGSRRSTRSNAFFTGIGRNRRIALFDTLVERHTPDELLAVLAHEIGHYREGHIPRGTALGILHTGLLLFLLSLALEVPALHQAFGMDRITVHGGLVFFAILYSPVELLLGAGLNALSRRHEFQADAFAARTTGNAGALVDALKKLSRDNLSNPTPHPFYVALNHSHPPVVERIRALGRLTAAAGGSPSL